MSNKLVHPSLPSFAVSVLINNQPVSVYDIKQEGNKVIGYIEAQTGQEFQISCTMIDKSLCKVSKACRLVTLLDGSEVDAVCHKHQSQKAKGADQTHTNTIQGYTNSHSTLRPFVFGQVSMTDDDAQTMTAGEEFYKGLGSIEVHYHRLQKMVKKPGGGGYVPPAFAKHSVHEAYKKAELSHQAESALFGGLAEYNPVSVRYLDPKKGPPFVSFEFRYCSRFLLETQNCLPANMMPAPAPADDSDDAVESNGDEAEEEQEKQKHEEEEEIIVIASTRRMAKSTGSQKSNKKHKAKREAKPVAKNEPTEVLVLD
ncbi:hypothetical protein ACM66B_005620 [Microbotryomycetes sp. NB124-2]